MGTSLFFIPEKTIEFNYNPLSNKGIITGYKVQFDSISKLVFAIQSDLSYWNNTARSTTNDTMIYSVNSMAASITASVGFPIQISSLRVTPALGYKSRFLLSSEGILSSLDGYIALSDAGYLDYTANLHRSFDHISFTASHQRFKKILLSIESEWLLFNIFDFDNVQGDFARQTDEEYRHININLRLCYDL